MLGRPFLSVIIILLFIGIAEPVNASACPSTISPFSVISTSFPQTAVGIGPGAQNVPFTVSLVYTGGCPISYAQFILGIKSPFSAPSGATTESEYQVNLQSYAIFQISYNLNVASYAKVGTYNLPLSIYYTPSNSSQFVQNITLPVYLLGSVYLNLSSSGSEYSLQAGQVNNVTFTIENAGSGNATQITLALAQPVQGLSILNQFPRFDSLPTGSNYSFGISIYASNQVAGSAITLPIMISYVNSYGLQEQQEIQIGFYVQGSSQASPVSVSVLTPQVSVAGSSELKILITNNGNYPIYSPSFTLTMPAGFAVTANSSYTYQHVIEPGQSFELDTGISTGPKTAEGAYTATLTMSYSDSAGNQKTTSFPLGFLAVGSIDLFLQGVTVSTSQRVATLSGTLLNEGSTSGYYLEMSGNMTMHGSIIAEGNTYVGEVDPNTPVPFSISFPLPADVSNGTVSVYLNAKYANDYGTNFSYNFPVQNYQLVLSIGQNNIQKVRSGPTLFTLTLIALLVIVIVALIITLLLSRRRRSKSLDEKVV
ncbi:MAG: NEW3 domain-containing protein [Nitrososphaerota archaeon]